MKKEFLIGMLFLMFAFVVGDRPMAEVDIGAKIECEALQVDQLATVDNVLLNSQLEVKTILNEAEVETSYGNCSTWNTTDELTSASMANCGIVYKDIIKNPIRTENLINGVADKIPLVAYNQKVNIESNANCGYRYLKTSGTDRVSMNI